MIIHQCKGIQITTMLKTQIVCKKRISPILLQEQASQILSKPRKFPFQPINQQITQKLIFQKPNTTQIWSKKQEENMLISFFEKIVIKPYMNFSWTYFQDQEILIKISRGIKKSLGSCLQKINQFKSVQEQKYSDLNFIDFLIGYWKEEKYRSRTGEKLIEKISELKKTKSDHMAMCEQMVERISEQQPALMKLYEFIMKN